MKKALFLVSLIVLLGVTVAHSFQQTTTIQIEGADAILEKALVLSQSLRATIRGIEPRILVDYADSVFIQSLEKPGNLDTSTSEVHPRILIDHADSVHVGSLSRPQLVGKLPSTLTVSSTLLSLPVNSTLTVTGHISPPLARVPITLTYVKPDGSSLTRSAVTDGGGEYSDSFRPYQTGRWNVRASWDGDDTYQGAKTSLLNIEVKPVIYTLTVQTPRKGFPVQVNGENYYTDEAGKTRILVSSDSNMVHLKVEPQVTEEDFRAFFQGWVDGEPSNERTLTINSDTILTAQYNLQYYLDVKANPSGVASVSGSGWYDIGSTITIETPQPLDEDRYELVDWTVNGESAGNKPPTIVMNKPYTITALYYKYKTLEKLLPTQETSSIKATTSSEIVKIVDTPSERKITVNINEPIENGRLEVFLPQGLLEAFNSSTERILVRRDGEESAFTRESRGDQNLIMITYPPGRHEIDIYYATYDLTVNVELLPQGQPVKDYMVQVYCIDETLLKQGKTDSAGMVKFTNLPRIVTISIQPESGFWVRNFFTKWESDVEYYDNPLTMIIDREHGIRAIYKKDFNHIILAGMPVIGGVGAYLYRRRRKEKALIDEATKLRLSQEIIEHVNESDSILKISELSTMFGVSEKIIHRIIEEAMENSLIKVHLIKDSIVSEKALRKRLQREIR